MRYITDLHIHSSYSRATSPSMSPEGLWRWSQIKGIGVVGTGDFTHPEWIKELELKLEPSEPGLFDLKMEFRPSDVPSSCESDVKFMLTAEVSTIYSKGGKVRKVHSIIFAPGFDEAKAINRALGAIGNLKSDGRPILGLDARLLLKIVMDASPDAMLIPAHVWTPHFSVFGSVSGFDSLEECYEELTPYIFAIETGLSSDPSMNRRLSKLDNIRLISNSDCHSPQKLGREATIFDTEKDYYAIMQSIKTGKGLEGTIEFFPEEGKYHMDGHRNCQVSMTPEETIKNNYLCPVCKKKLTVGVLHRVAHLADREEPAKTGFVSLIPLAEVISHIVGKGVNTKAVDAVYVKMIERFGCELGILMDTPVSEIEREFGGKLAGAIGNMRKGRVSINAGYDGQYGVIKPFMDD